MVAFLISLASVDHPDAQVKPPYVRCKIKSGGYIVRPTQEPDEFQICFMLQADPQGWLPNWVKALVAWKVQMFLVVFQKYYYQNFGPAGK